MIFIILFISEELESKFASKCEPHRVKAKQASLEALDWADAKVWVYIHFIYILTLYNNFI